MAALPRRPTRSKRLSALRLSTDTTPSLPAYSAPPRPAPASHWPPASPPLDQPPDYPQSADEADREDDDFVPLRLPRNPVHRRLRHRRTGSTSSVSTSSVSAPALPPSSPSVDDLLERSVVALELSTDALRQSMNTQSSLSAIANDQILERSLDRQTRMLDLRLRGNHAAHNDWMQNLDDVMKSVDGLFLDSPDTAISRSLPDRTSLSSQHTSAPGSAYFHLTTSSEIDLRDTLHPPRALTQYVSVQSSCGDASDATADPESIFLPSTLGLRSAAGVQTLTNGSPLRRIRKTASSPGPEFSTPSNTSAYNILSHLASGQSSRSPSRTGTPSTSDSRSRRTLRRHSAGSADSNLTRRPRSQTRSGSSASTDMPPPPPLPPVRAMTPPMEESTPSSSDSSSEDNKVKAFRAMESLRKILDDAPPPDPKGKRPAVPPRRGFQPRSPAVAPSAGESTATASVYRLFTRSSHHHASASRPTQSSLKKSPRLLTPVPPGTPSASSGHNTPRQVSFAELPADHPGRPRNKNKGRRKSGKEKEAENKSWLSWFAAPGALPGSATGVYEERMEDKMMRGWGRPGAGGGSTDDWML